MPSGWSSTSLPVSSSEQCGSILVGLTLAPGIMVLEHLDCLPWEMADKCPLKSQPIVCQPLGSHGAKEGEGEGSQGGEVLFLKDVLKDVQECVKGWGKGSLRPPGSPRWLKLMG